MLILSVATFRFYGKHHPPRHLWEGPVGKCPSADMLDVVCPSEVEEDDLLAQLRPKAGVFLVIILTRTFANWLAEITKLIDFSDRSVMQLRVFYAQASIKYRNVSPEQLNDEF